MILINEPKDFPDSALEKLREVGPVFFKGEQFDKRIIKAIFVRLNYKVDREFVEPYCFLKYVVSPTTGLNHIDQKELFNRGIKIISLKGETQFLNSIKATAEHTIALTLALIRKIPAAYRSVETGNWDRYPFKGTEISGSRVFILGYGRVGRQVAHVYRAMNATVMAYDIESSVVPEEMRVDLSHGFEASDLVSVHIPYSDKNHEFISRQLLNRMKENAVFVNTSRGEVVDQDALFDQLEQGRLGGVGLDVLSGEPSPILKRVHSLMASEEMNLLVTPHISGFTYESLEKVENFVVDKLIQKISDS